MNYEVRAGNTLLEGPFAVLDTALHAAQKITRPPPAPPKQYTHVARQFGTTDEDPYMFGPAQPSRITSVLVVEREGRPGTPRTRAYVTDGKVAWAKECKSCKGTGTQGNGIYGYLCHSCHGMGTVADRSQP